MKKNILHVFSGEYRRGHGIYTVIDALFRRINLEEFSLTLYTSVNKDESFPYRVERSNSVSFSELLTSKDFDLVVFHGIYFRDYLKKFILCIKHDIPYLIKPHGSLVTQSLRKSAIKKKLFFLLGMKYYLKRSAGILFINEEERQNSINFYTSSFIESNLIPLELHKNKKPSQKVRFLYFSRIDFYHKGLDVLIDSLRMLPKEIQDELQIDFYGVGDENSTNLLKRNILDKKLSFVQFKGGISSDEDKAKMFSKSDILLLTSRYEGFPTVIAEALSYGIPPVVTPGTNSLFLMEAGIGWETKLKPMEISRTIQRAAKDYKWDQEKIVSECLSYVKREFDPDKNIRKIENLYRDLCRS